MFETIVWATDGSERADRALPFVLDLARTHRSKIVAVHAAEGHVLTGYTGGPAVVADDSETAGKIERQVEELREAGYTAELRVVRDIDSVAAVIARSAHDVHAGLIVIGTHGRGVFTAALLGSVARGLQHAAECPVLAVPAAEVREPALV